MKDLTEAVQIFKNQINAYRKTCLKENGEVFIDVEAFFYNFFPSKEHGGKTGYARATAFISNLENAVMNNKITNTQELLQFAIDYQDKGHKLSSYIRLAIRRSAGFTEEHVEYLVPIYQDRNTKVVYYHKDPQEYYEQPSKAESRENSRYLIDEAICGYYRKSLLELVPLTEKLTQKLELKNENALSALFSKKEGSPSCLENHDYGATLLEYLQGNIPTNACLFGK